MFKLDDVFDDTDLTNKQTLDSLSMLQANILKGHGRDHVALLFLQIADVQGARQFLNRYPVTDAATQFVQAEAFREAGEPGGLVRLVMISNAGLAEFGQDTKFAAGNPNHDPFFVLGMAKDKDVLDGGTTDSWQAALKDTVHVLLLFAHDDQRGLAGVVAKALENIRKPTSGFEVLLVQEGSAYRNAANEGIEHFGYVDGRSQPLMTIGELRKESATRGGTAVYDPKAFLNQFIFEDPLAAGAGFGSYFVFRKLEQNVAGFKNAEDKLQSSFDTPPGNDDLAGAMIVGRFENGIPTTQWTTPPAVAPVTNDFNYVNDPGARCPFQAHIRKTNPRGSSPGGPVFDKGVQMARRGITYGVRMQDPETKELLDNPNDGVGLLFMSYQTSINNQFHVMQANWANSRIFPHVNPGETPVGIDPIIGQLFGPDNAEIDQKWPGHNAPKQIQGFVHLKGGEYFYAPSPEGLKNL